MDVRGERQRDREVGNLLDGRRPVSRRRFLELLAGAGVGTAAVPALADIAGGTGRPFGGVALPPGYLPGFPDGISSGDPRPDGTVIWTRLTSPAGGETLPVLWEVATDDTFTAIAAGGATTAVAGDDWTVHMPVSGLAADSWYVYRFTVGATTSPIGRLRTAPTPGATPERLRFAFASCQQRGTTYAALRAISEEPDLDFFMHLGDYVYVSDGGTITLDDYRSVYKAFKSDAQLQLCHQQVPLVAMLDDGEYYNGIDNTGDPARLAAAMSAWFETMPLIGPAADPTQAYRTLGWGDLADVFMLDVRSYRDPAVDAIDTTTPEGAVALAPGRTTLGDTQRQWLLDGLSASQTCWRFLGNPYNMALWRLADLDPGPPRPPGVQVGEGVYAPNEAWDDYSWERRQILEHLALNDIANTISVSGHTHIWIASDMSPDPDDPASPVVAFDFTTGSLTADPDLVMGEPDPAAAVGFFTDLARESTVRNPWQTFMNFISFGYTVVEVVPGAVTVECKAIDVYDPGATPEVLARFRVHGGASAMETQFFSVPCWSCPDPDVVSVPAFGPGTGLTEPAAACVSGQAGPTPTTVPPSPPASPTPTLAPYPG